MTDTTPAAVERNVTDVIDTIASGMFYEDYDQSSADLKILRTISSQLEAATRRAGMLANSLATARADALKDAVKIADEKAANMRRSDMYGKAYANDVDDVSDAILALIHASPAEPARVTPQDREVAYQIYVNEVTPTGSTRMDNMTLCAGPNEVHQRHIATQVDLAFQAGWLSCLAAIAGGHDE